MQNTGDKMNYKDDRKMNYEDDRMFKDEHFDAIEQYLDACCAELGWVESKWETFPKAWRKCDKPRLYAWLIIRLAVKHDYYRRAALSVVSQILYDFHIQQHEQIEELTEMLDRISEGDDEWVTQARSLGRGIIRNLEKKGRDVYIEPMENALSGLDCAVNMLSKKLDEYYFEEALETVDWKKGCQLIRKMVDRPNLEEIKACKRR